MGGWLTDTTPPPVGKHVGKTFSILGFGRLGQTRVAKTQRHKLVLNGPYGRPLCDEQHAALRTKVFEKHRDLDDALPDGDLKWDVHPKT